MNLRTALFPGSFDPITLGHLDLIQRALQHFDRLIIGIGHNSDKKNLFSLETRLKWLQELLGGDNRVQVVQYQDLTAKFCQEIGASFILRGLRNTADFESEKSIAQLNKDLFDVETFFLVCDPGLQAVSSSIVREIVLHGGNPAPLVPAVVARGISALRPSEGP
ncbi:MAG: pantetheine-phosphate adenylyltransferase [Bacteroidota bacterium]